MNIKNYFALTLVLFLLTEFLWVGVVVFAFPLGGWRFIGTAPIFFAGAEIALDLLAPLQLGSEIELNAARSFSPQS